MHLRMRGFSVIAPAEVFSWFLIRSPTPTFPKNVKQNIAKSMGANVVKGHLREDNQFYHGVSINFASALRRLRIPCSILVPTQTRIILLTHAAIAV